MASSVFELGMKLLQEINEPPQQPAKKTSSVELDGVCDVLRGVMWGLFIIDPLCCFNKY